MLELAPLPSPAPKRAFRKRTLKDKEATKERLEKKLWEDLATTAGRRRYMPPARSGSSRNPNGTFMFNVVDSSFLNQTGHDEAVAILEGWNPAAWKGQVWRAHRNIDRVWTGPTHHDLQWNGVDWVIYKAQLHSHSVENASDAADPIFYYPRMSEAPREFTGALLEDEDEESGVGKSKDVIAEKELNVAYMEYEEDPIGQRDSLLVKLYTFARSRGRIKQVNRFLKNQPEIYLDIEDIFSEFNIDLMRRIESEQYMHAGEMQNWIGYIWGNFFFPGIETKVYRYADRNTYVNSLDPDLEDYELQNHAVGLFQIEDEQAELEQEGYTFPISRDKIFRQMNAPTQALVEMLAKGMTREEMAVDLRLSPSQLRRRLGKAVEDGEAINVVLPAIQGCADGTTGNLVLWPIQAEDDKLSRWLRDSRSYTAGAVVTRIDASLEPHGGESFDIQACADESERRFLTAEEAAAYLGGLNSRTLTRWAREGYIPAIPIGEGKRRLWRFLRTDLESWMLARRQGGQNAA